MAVTPETKTLALTLNGRPARVDNVESLSLLDVLRDRLGVISPKNGCQPMGQCGCCTVLVDGKPRLSCTMKAELAEGKEVVTLEGLPEEARRQLADCFVRAGGVQCGYCIPGIAVRSYAMLDKNAEPSREVIAKELRPHLCRCTGYTKILDAVELLARVRRGEHLEVKAEAGRVGTSLDRYRSWDAVLGDRHFIDDVRVPGMAFAAMRFSDHPRALVRGIDVSAAEAMPGVLRVATAKDIPGDRYVGLINQDWPVMVAEGEETRCVGDVIAAVAATDIHVARAAAVAIKVDYEVREPVVDPHDAIRPDAPKIHKNGNMLDRAELVRGDATAALAASTHVVEGTWQTQRIEHLFLEPESCLAIPVKTEGGKVKRHTTNGKEISWHDLKEGIPFEYANGQPPKERGLYVLSQGQGIFDDRRQICKLLGWPEDRVAVELVSNGGAFGGKEDMSIQGQTALMAHLVGGPVKTVLTREESFRLHPKRHPIEMKLKVGCDADGHITALYARIIGDTGAYASVGAKVLERCAGHIGGPYRIPAADIEAITAYTNNPPCGAMRGFGANQAAFAIEGAMDMLAEKVSIDGWEMRNRNILEPGDVFLTGQRMSKPFGLRKTLEAVKDAYRGAKFAGIACGIKNVGIGNGLPETGRASITIEPGGRATIRSGFTEMGQGLFTVLIQTAVEETGLPADIFGALTDTRDDTNCGQTTGSRGTVLGCMGVMDAARKLKADLDAGKTLENLVGRVYEGRWDCYKTDKFGANVPDPRTHLTYGYATQVVILDDDGRVTKVIAAHDAGRVINPVMAEGQIEGSIHMGLGYALTEDFEVEGGFVKAKNINACGVLRAHQMPDVEVILVEEPDPETPYGSRGIGEIGLVPTAGAVAGALYAFDQIRRFKLPMKDSPAAVMMKKPRKKH